jgi:thiol-disulfide isomerase/thioredoxin
LAVGGSLAFAADSADAAKDAAGKAADAAKDAANKAADAATDATPKKRGVQEIMQEFQTTSEGLREGLASPRDLADEAKRTAAAPKVVPVLKKMTALIDELEQTGDPQGKMIAKQVSPQLKTFLALFGDADTLASFEKQTKSDDSKQAAEAKVSLLLVSWVKASKDSAAQEKLLDEARNLAKEYSKDPGVTRAMMGMAELGAASPELADKAKEIALSMDNQVAMAAKGEVDHEKQLRSMENKPLTIEGVKLDGSKFSTADWKGKVIFVDFWATWCGPCREELPRVKKAYADFHDKGLEVLGVSCDNNAEALTKFLEKDKAMAWPQLFDSAHPGWHALATSYGIEGIPTMFLIDKKGILRSVSARENFEEMIPKLLAEKTE